MALRILTRLNDFFKLMIWGTIPNDICRNQFSQIWSNIIKFKPWALQMLDSTAKIPAGLLTGNTVQMGNMAECLEVDVKEEFGSFTGKHCMVEYSFAVQSLKLQNKSGRFFWGVCIPSSCSATDLEYFLRYTLHLPASVEENLCHTANNEVPFGAHEIVAICIISLLLMLAILSTIYDYATSKSHKNPYLISFSIRTNMRNLLDTKTPTGYVRVLDGLRFFALFGIVLSQVYRSFAFIGPHINKTTAKDWLSDWQHVWLNRCVSFDTLMLIGGVLVSYLFMDDREKDRKMNFFVYYIYRYIRVIPALALVLLLTATMYNRMNSAPFYQSYGRTIEEKCQSNWWWYIIFIYNWKEFDECMGHVWFLCAAIQLYFLAPLLLIPLHYRPKLGTALMFLVLVVLFFTSFGISYGFEEKVDFIRTDSQWRQKLLYGATYQRATSGIIGFILGYYLHKYKKHTTLSGEENKGISWGTPFLGIVAWIIIILLACAVMAATHPFVQPDYKEVYNATESAIYLAFYHVVWALVVVLFIVVCLTGYGGIFNTISSSEVFVPLSRLTLSTYMIHLYVIQYRLSVIQTPDYLNDYNMVLLTISTLMTSVFCAFPIYLLAERPAIVLVTLLLNKEKSRSEPQSLSLPSTSTEAATLPVRGSLRDRNSNYELTERDCRRPEATQ
ncbi:nose resistant to fluoxetine protein 6-like [Periplaneta americana]|uniref:nose resistant to fluoxetine protein 6-like n=1 Tax=Periplaneta americana TaxID=6978 RepID=UPI0037E78079